MFVAVDMTSAAKDAAASLIEELRSLVPGARWVPRDNLHVTIKFLGHVPDERIPGIEQACGVAVGASGGFDVRMGGLGVFPSPRRARVIWIGLDDPTGGFAALSNAVEDAINPLGFERESRAFTAHLTIARLKAPAPVILPSIDLDLGVRVEGLTLFRSHLGRPAPRYEVLATFASGSS